MVLRGDHSANSVEDGLERVKVGSHERGRGLGMGEESFPNENWILFTKRKSRVGGSEDIRGVVGTRRPAQTII